MNQIGEIRGKIDVKRKQELDGSWVICANQHTSLTRTSSGDQQTLTCELITDHRSYSTLTSIIIMKGNWNLIKKKTKVESIVLDAMEADPDIDPPDGYTPPPRDGSNNGDYFDRQKPSAAGRHGKLMTGVSFSLFYSKKRTDFRNFFFLFF
jgi:hypothetical protein